MSKFVVFRNRPNISNIGGIEVYPSFNTFTEEQAELLKGMASFVKQVEAGILEIVAEQAEDGANALYIAIKDLSVQKAEQFILDCSNKADLNGVFSLDSRVGIKRLVSLQLVTLGDDSEEPSGGDEMFVD